MQLGGVMLGAGMNLYLNSGDYLHGNDTVVFTMSHIICTCTEHNCDWVVLDGYQQPSATSPWRPRRLQVRITALKRCLALLT